MKRLGIFLVLAAAGGVPAPVLSVGQTPVATAQGDGEAEDIAAIRTVYAGWNAAVESGNIAGYLAALDEDVELMLTDAPPIRGRDNYAVFLEPVFAADSFEIEIADTGTIEVDGDLAWARYDYIIHRLPGGSATRISSYRKFLDVLRRQPDGSWRVLKHIWNYNEPGVTP